MAQRAVGTDYEQTTKRWIRHGKPLVTTAKTVDARRTPGHRRAIVLTKTDSKSNNHLKATLNKPSKISAQTWMTQFFGLLCLSRGPFGQFAGR